MACGEPFNPWEGAELVSVEYDRRHPWWKFWRHEMAATFVFRLGPNGTLVITE